jgi:hypothetical protein
MIARAPLFLPADLIDFDVYWNRAAVEDAAVGSLTFGLASVVGFAGEQPLFNRANMVLYNENKRKEAKGFYFFIPGSYGRAIPGTKDFKMEGDVRFRTRESLLTDDVYERDAGGAS